MIANGVGVMREGWHQTIRAFAENASDAILATDDGGSVLYANPPATALFGPTATIIGATLHNLLKIETTVDEKVPSRTDSSAIRAMIRDGSPFEIADAGGQRRFVTVAIGKIACNGYMGFIVLARDLNPHVECEERATAASSSLESILEMAPVGIHAFDSQRCITMVNRTFLDLIGRSREEVVGHEWTELVAPEQRPVFALHWEALQRGDSVQHAPYVLVHRSGRRVQVLLSAFPDRALDGELEGVRAIVTDITPRWEAEKKINDIESDYKRLFSMNLAGVYRATLDGTLVDCNDTFARTLGYDDSRSYLAASPLPHGSTVMNARSSWRDCWIGRP